MLQYLDTFTINICFNLHCNNNKKHNLLSLFFAGKIISIFFVVMEKAVQLVVRITVVFVVALFVKCAWRVWDSVWVRPRQVEKCLRKQGLRGNSYRFLYGDVKDNLEMSKKAMSTPMNLSGDVATRAIPFIHQTINKYGNTYSLHQNIFFTVSFFASPTHFFTSIVFHIQMVCIV